MVGDSMISGIVWYIDMCKWHAYQPVKVVGAWLTWLTWLLLHINYVYVYTSGENVVGARYFELVKGLANNTIHPLVHILLVNFVYTTMSCTFSFPVLWLI